MKKVIALVLVVMMTLGVGSVAFADKLDDVLAAGKLIVGAEVSFPPYEFYIIDPETGTETLAGFEMMMAQGLAKELGVEFVLADQQFAGLITALRGGEIDVIISGMAVKPDRMEVVDFSTPYYIGEQTVVIRKADADLYKTPEDFNGKKIGAQLGSLQASVAEEQFSGAAETMLLDKVPLLIMELNAGNIDGVICTDIVAKSYMEVYPDITISEVPVVFTSAGVAVGVAKGENERFMEAINNYIAKVTENGEFDEWFTTAMQQNGQLLQAEADAASATEAPAEVPAA